MPSRTIGIIPNNGVWGYTAQEPLTYDQDTLEPDSLPATTADIIPGDDGPTIRRGTDDPDETVLGVIGDVYFRLSSGQLTSARVYYCYETNGTAAGSRWFDGIPKIPTKEASFKYVGTVVVGAIADKWKIRGGDFTIISITGGVATAPTGAYLEVATKVNGTEVTTSPNRLRIAISATDGETTTIATPNVSEGDYITIEVTQIGSTVAGADLTVQVHMKAR